MTIKKRKKLLSPGACIGFLVFLLIFCIYIVSIFSEPFADFINGTVCSGYRFVMAKFGDLFPFSLYEFVLITIPLQVIIFLWLAIRRFKSGEGRGRFVLNFLAAALALYSGHLLALGIGYNTTPVTDKLDISEVEINENNLSDTLIYLREDINGLSAEIKLNDAGISESGYTLDEISARICLAYTDFSAKEGFPMSFDSKAKGITFSRAMSYFSLMGIYTFYTGEANVNMLYPDFDIVFSAAHELSHQRGISREDEANFMAYLVLSRSADPYLRYSAALSAYGYVGAALYKTNPEKYFEINSSLSKTAVADLTESNRISGKYGDTVFSDISRFVNDLFLKSGGTEGVVSYGMVTRHIVAYLAPKI